MMSELNDLRHEVRRQREQIDNLEQQNRDLRVALMEAQAAIKSLDVDALGIGRSSDGRYRWPLRMELLSKIEQALDIGKEE